MNTLSHNAQANASVISANIDDIRNDIGYIDTLTLSLRQAQSAGVQVGDVLQNLDNQKIDLHAKIIKIGNDIDLALQKLVHLEESIKKDDTKLVLTQDMLIADKFKLVYDRLMEDEQSLSLICSQIENWNNNNAVTIDISSA